MISNTSRHNDQAEILSKRSDKLKTIMRQKSHETPPQQKPKFKLVANTKDSGTTE